MADSTSTDGTLGIAGQSLDARGRDITASTGYIFNVGNVIIEPSLGVVYTSVSVDPLNFTTPIPAVLPLPIPGTINIQDIETLLGRAGVRFATNLTADNLAVQPFVAASVRHEFAGDLSGTYRSQRLAEKGVSDFGWL